MKRWHILALGLSLALLLLSVAGFLLPSSYVVERAISIEASTTSTFNTIADLNTWPTWSPWQKNADSTLVYTYTGAPGTPGSKLAWTGNSVGSGEITITQLNPADGVFYEISASGETMAKGQARFLDKGDTRTRVAFTYSAELGWNPMQRFAGLFADGQVGPQFEAALLRLKATLESKP
jgi:hypothetical protein